MRLLPVLVLLQCPCLTPAADDETAFVQTRVASEPIEGREEITDPPQISKKDANLVPGILYWQAESVAPNGAALVVEMLAAALHNHLHDPWIVQQRNLISKKGAKKKGTAVTVKLTQGSNAEIVDKMPLTKRFAGWDKVPRGGVFRANNGDKLPSTAKLLQMDSTTAATDILSFKINGQTCDKKKCSLSSAELDTKYHLGLKGVDKIKNGVIQVLIQKYWDAFGSKEHDEEYTDKNQDAGWKEDQLNEWEMSCKLCGDEDEEVCKHEMAGGMGVPYFQLLLPKCPIENSEFEFDGNKMSFNKFWANSGATGKIAVNLRITDKDKDEQWTARWDLALEEGQDNGKIMDPHKRLVTPAEQKAIAKAKEAKKDDKPAVPAVAAVKNEKEEDDTD